MLRIDRLRAGVQVVRDVDVSKANVLHFVGPSMIAVDNHPKAITATDEAGQERRNTVAIARLISYPLSLLQIGEEARDARICPTRAHYQP